MKTIGFIGLGKLGVPVALCMATRGHVVLGYDIDSKRMTKDRTAFQDWERGPSGTSGSALDYLSHENYHLSTPEDIVAKADVIFVAVPTPHDPRFEGVTPLPTERMDFDYGYVLNALREIIRLGREIGRRNIPVALISTVLPGTYEKTIKPTLDHTVCVFYNPQFIAMGTTCFDFLNPEFVLIGRPDGNGETDGALMHLVQAYKDMDIGPLRIMRTSSAEMVKCCYNTFISLKIAFSNIVGEACGHVGADVDEVTDTLMSATRRLVSTYYMQAGMGDQGSCHPRDNIAMSFFARHAPLSYDIFEAAMMAREKHALLLATRLWRLSQINRLPIIIHGYCYKPNVPITAGSHALLVGHFLSAQHIDVEYFDPVLHGPENKPNDRAVYLIGCKHDGIEKWVPPRGSVVIDPFRCMPKSIPGVQVIRIGAAPIVCSNNLVK